MCPICRTKEIKCWESACWSCWNNVKRQDDINGTHYCDNLIIFNIVRETCRECGLDPIEGFPW